MVDTRENHQASFLARITELEGKLREAEGKPCGDCRQPIRPACRCAEHLRICAEQQRAEQAEGERDALRARAACDYMHVGNFCNKCGWSSPPEPAAEEGMAELLEEDRNLGDEARRSMDPLLNVSPATMMQRLAAQKYAEPAPEEEEKGQAGLYEKYKIERTDGRSAPGEDHDGCEYFVLDLSHDPFAIGAINAYAAACESECPELARDLLKMLQPEPAADEGCCLAFGCVKGTIGSEHLVSHAPGCPNGAKEKNDD